jgi:predicted ribosome quality control (RQC) complex YloA/Tae2 family protein
LNPVYIAGMVSSLDITRILAESVSSLIGGNITAIDYYRKERTVQIIIEASERLCLTFSFHPQWNGLYILSPGRSRLETTEKPRPFAREACGGDVSAIRQILNDRIVEIAVASKKNSWLLAVEALGPNGNLWLLDSERRMVASLRPKVFTVGRPYQTAALPPKFDPALITADDLRTLIQADPGLNLARLLEKNLYGIDYYLAQTILPPEASASALDFEDMHRKLQAIVRSYHTPDTPIYAYRIKERMQFYPVKLGDREPLGRYKSLSLAQREVMGTIKETTETESVRETTIKSIEARLAKAKRLLARLEADLAEAADYERYLQLADLLKINLHRLRRGLAHVRVDDLYHDGEEVDIPLDPKLNGPANIESYTKRYRKGKEGLELMTRRREITIEETKQLQAALSRFSDDFEQAVRDYPELAPQATASSAPDARPRLPYKEYQTSTGLTILVGKTEADNDRLTLEYTKPFELWFHASQCPGSHVVMKFPHRDFVPSKREIEETAALAAHFSRARTSGKVPVSYTLRKHVRKPRGAKPGLVTIEREKTILVAPRELKKKE